MSAINPLASGSIGIETNQKANPIANADKVQEKWGYYPNLHIIRKGAGERKETLKFYHHAQSELSSLYYPDEKEADFRMATLEAVEEIDVVSLDEFCEERYIDHIDFLKVDTEGMTCLC